MSALDLYRWENGEKIMVHMRFRASYTAASIIVCAFLTRVGIEVALHDCFGGKDRCVRSAFSAVKAS